MDEWIKYNRLFFLDFIVRGRFDFWKMDFKPGSIRFGFCFNGDVFGFAYFAIGEYKKRETKFIFIFDFV